MSHFHPAARRGIFLYWFKKKKINVLFPGKKRHMCQYASITVWMWKAAVLTHDTLVIPRKQSTFEDHQLFFFSMISTQIYSLSTADVRLPVNRKSTLLWFWQNHVEVRLREDEVWLLAWKMLTGKLNVRPKGPVESVSSAALLQIACVHHLLLCACCGFMSAGYLSL